MRELTLAVVGIDYPNADGSNRRSAAMMTLPGAPVALVPEPKNPHDGNAVAVIGPHGIQLGYVSAERAPLVAGRMARGDEVSAIFQDMHGARAFVRVRFGGGQPTLPPPSGEAAFSAQGMPSSRICSPDPDAFHPDEDGPEYGA